MSDRAASFQRGNVNSLRQRLAELFGNENEVRAYKEQAQEYVCEKYDWDEVTERTVELYIRA